MLRFFRTIRKKLIEEDNVRKYLLYAIGEILLVVIGILIALQVNNWNENRKQQTLRNQLIENYVNDLRSNQLYLNERIQPAKADQQFLNNASERLKASPSPIDTLKKITLTEFNPQIWAIADLKNNTFNSMVASNQLRLIPRDLSEMMIKLDFKMNDLISTQNLVSEFYRNALTDYSSSMPLPYSFSSYSENETEMLWNSIENPQKKMAFNGLLFAKNAAYLSVIPRADSLVVQINDLLSFIERNHLVYQEN